MKDFKWGIIGYGAIAGKFAEAVANLDGMRTHAVFGRNFAGASAFASENNIENTYPSLDAFLADDSIDAVYIAAPNSAHYELTKAALGAGKHVLCEKPFMTRAADAEEMIAYAREKKLFLSEAVWTKTLSVYKELRRIVRDGKIGDIRLITAEYFYDAEYDPNGRLFNKELGGGSMLDIGVYELALVSMFLGTKPVDIKSTAKIGETGVDELTSITLQFSEGEIAHMVCSVRASGPFRAGILGTRGRIEIPEFGRAQKASVFLYKTVGASGANSLGKGTRKNEPESDILELQYPHEINGFEYQVRAVADAIRTGKIECDLMPLNETLDQLRIIDAARSQWTAFPRAFSL